MMANKIKLPHEGEEIDRIIRQIKEAVRGTRTTVVAGVEITYSICDPWSPELDLAMYDQNGKIYLPEEHVRSNPISADLSAYHEHTEIRHKRAGRAHGYAHHRGLLEELLAAKQMLDKEALTAYVHERMSGYPDWKIPDKSAIATRLCVLLSAERPLRGKLLEVFKEARM
jgi:hypothetical protein